MIAIDSKPIKIRGKIGNFVRLIPVKSPVYPSLIVEFKSTISQKTRSEILNFSWSLKVNMLLHTKIATQPFRVEVDKTD